MTQLLESPVGLRSRVFLLVQVEPGLRAAAQSFLQGAPGAVEVSATSGPYDLIVTAEAGGPDAVSRLVAACRRTPGLVRINRCEAVRH